MYIYSYELEIGKISIVENRGKITNLYFANDCLPSNIQIRETPVLKEAFRQLSSYLAGDLKKFLLPLDPQGTLFMQKVWDCLCQIPYGQTVSYKEIAEKVGSPKAFRAVGLANNRNPVPIFIPCHRVIGANGLLTGYRGGIQLKRRLLDLEKGLF